MKFKFKFPGKSVLETYFKTAFFLVLVKYYFVSCICICIFSPCQLPIIMRRKLVSLDMFLVRVSPLWASTLRFYLLLIYF